LWQRERERNTHTVFVKDFGECETNFLILGDDQFCGVGPNLHGFLGMTSGTTRGFTYSTAYKNKDVFVWTEEHIYDYLLNPKKVRKIYLFGLRSLQGEEKFQREGGTLCEVESLVLVAGRRLAKLNTDNVMEGKHRYNILVFNLAFSLKVSIFKSRSTAAICTELHSFSRKKICVPARTFDTYSTWSCCVVANHKHTMS
jgi:hypothetical protein